MRLFLCLAFFFFSLGNVIAQSVSAEDSLLITERMDNYFADLGKCSDPAADLGQAIKSLERHLVPDKKYRAAEICRKVSIGREKTLQVISELRDMGKGAEARLKFVPNIREIKSKDPVTAKVTVMIYQSVLFWNPSPAALAEIQNEPRISESPDGGYELTVRQKSYTVEFKKVDSNWLLVPLESDQGKDL